MTDPPLALSRLHFPIRSLGPGKRIGIWFQGCSIRCPGCVSMDTWAEGRGMTTVAAVVAAVEPWLGVADGITVSGGEPFDQPAALRTLLAAFRARHPGDILVYSGYPVEALDLSAFEGLVDALISDPLFIEAPQTRPLRGSDNQRLVRLTPLGEQRFAGLDEPAPTLAPALDVMFDDESGEVFLAGIPRRGDLRRLAHLLADAGHRVATTEDARQTR